MMAICTHCNQEMRDGNGCTQAEYEFVGQKYPRRPYGTETREDDTGKLINQWAGEVCHDCHVPRGSLHHPGCDAEECPKCGNQAIGCSCDDPRCEKCGRKKDYVEMVDGAEVWECDFCRDVE